MKKSLLFLLLSSLCFVSCEKGSNDPDNTNPEEVYTEFPGGFIAIDGLDEATGRYRINVFPSSQPIGEAEGAYTDIVLFLYTMTKPTETWMPVGEAQPYSMTGANIANEILYNPGRHFYDKVKECDNMAGSGWWSYDDDGKVEGMYAAHIGNQQITFDEEKSEYTIKGEMTDTINVKTLRYTFTTENDFLMINQ